jgi:molybdate transport system ATP-binding protein
MLEAHVIKTLDSGFRLDGRLSTGKGRVTALFGPSGAGKSTLASCIAGLIRPDEGHIELDGETLFGPGVDLAPHRRHIGYVFQEPRLFPHLSVTANLLYGLRRTPKPDRRVAFDQVVKMLDIAPLLTRRPLSLSGGEKSRVAFGRAVLSSPRLLIFDEPLASLDGARKAEMLPFIERLRDELAIPMIYVSHAVEEILRLADDVAVMANGSITQIGPAVEILNSADFVHAGDGDAGSVIEATISRADASDGLSELRSGARVLYVPQLALAEGSTVRLRIRARDIAISRERPTGISVLNILPARVATISDGPAASVDIVLDAGSSLRARITRRSARELGLAPGTEVFALIKSVAIDRGTGG